MREQPEGDEAASDTDIEEEEEDSDDVSDAEDLSDADDTEATVTLSVYVFLLCLDPSNRLYRS